MSILERTKKIQVGTLTRGSILKNSKNLQNLLVGVQDITFFKGGMCTIQKGIFDIEIIVGI